MNRPPLLDEEDENELETDLEDDYRPLDFDDHSRFDRRTEPDLDDDLNRALDILEDEEAKDEIDREEERIEAEIFETEAEEL